jgi:CRP-like cAMP-binding protein
MFFELSGHLYCLCQRSIRGKVLKFLNYCVEHYRSYEFDITFSREDLANYLAVDRASLSRTLGELKADGVIDFRKNHFKVLSTKYFQYR